MNNEYIAVPATKTDNGIFAVSKTVIESIASIAVGEMSEVKIPEKTAFNPPVICKIVDKSINLTISIRIKYNRNIATTCLAVQNKINQALQQTLALTCHNIDVRVVGFII